MMNIRPLAKLALVRKMGGGSERKTGVYTPVHEDLSTEPTNQFSTRVEFCKRSIDSILKNKPLMQRGETEILLAHVLRVDRSYLYAHGEQHLTSEQEALLNTLIDKRKQGEPIAYLTGHKEFWSLDFKVTPDVLIPRPETEQLVEIILEKQDNSRAMDVLDLGTGSGAVAIALAHERPRFNITATDQSEKALMIARENAEKLKVHNVHFILSDWFTSIPEGKFDIIVSNPPYIAQDDWHLQNEIRFEPMSALVSGSDGLNDIRSIIKGAKRYLKPGGFLLLEHGYDQGKAAREIFLQHQFHSIKTYQDLSGLDRVTSGYFLYILKQRTQRG